MKRKGGLDADREEEVVLVIVWKRLGGGGGSRRTSEKGGSSGELVAGGGIENEEDGHEAGDAGKEEVDGESGRERGRTGIGNMFPR